MKETDRDEKGKRVRNSRSTWLIAARSTETNIALAHGGAGNGLCGLSGLTVLAAVGHLSVFGFVLSRHAADAVVGSLRRLVLSGHAVDAFVGPLLRKLSGHAILAGRGVRHIPELAGLAWNTRAARLFLAG